MWQVTTWACLGKYLSFFTLKSPLGITNILNFLGQFPTCELKRHLPAYVVVAGWSAGTVVGSVVAGCASALFPDTGSQLDAAGAAASVLLQPATVLT